MRLGLVPTALALVTAGPAAAQTIGPATAQETWELRNPGYRSSPDVPRFGFVTDLIGEAAGLGRLREFTLPEGVREARIWVGFGIFIPHKLLRLVDDGSVVTGELFHWWSSFDDFRTDPAMSDFRADMERLAGRFGCSVQPNGHITTTMRGAERIEQQGWSGVCRADFGDGEPTWSEVLASLERLGVFTLPGPETLTPPSEVVVLDGVSMQVEVLEGAAYRTYTFGNPGAQPWPEAQDAARILMQVLEMGPGL